MKEEVTNTYANEKKDEPDKSFDFVNNFNNNIEKYLRRIDNIFRKYYKISKKKYKLLL